MAKAVVLNHLHQVVLYLCLSYDVFELHVYTGPVTAGRCDVKDLCQNKKVGSDHPALISFYGQQLVVTKKLPVKDSFLILCDH